ncbi:alpha/beta fold hydrolase [Williamsia sp. CHRR-6]|uniref:alpha/beta fold hydrolase n=1 Tax=Williamsia sp. CHRR-6 TaxID=2835871 RepID=UPI001BDB0987|nr:alpha/beta hydrolase [Williamsia sp. CHRR-6]MBT0566210.1 alpha/beta hydrolase [Williamsia sp. CHRR-6]
MTATALTCVSTYAAATAAPTASVPATPDTAALAGSLTKQKLTWGACDYGDPDTNAKFAQPNVNCTTVKVPRDWHNPRDGKTWNIRVSQAFNSALTDSRHKGTIFVNPGGPGGDGLPWAAGMQIRTPDLQPYYNYVGFDPRGVGQSTHAGCEISQVLSDAIKRLQDQSKLCSETPDVKLVNTEQTTYDMDFIRVLLGERKISYVGYSYGTWLGTRYANTFAAHTDKVLLDSALDVTEPTMQRTFGFQTTARERIFTEELLPYITRHNDLYKLGTDRNALYKRYFAATSKLSASTVKITWIFSGASNLFYKSSAITDAADVVVDLINAGEKAGTTPSSPPSSSDPMTSSTAEIQPADPAGEVRATMSKIVADSTSTQAQKRSAQRLSALVAPLTDLSQVSRSAVDPDNVKYESVFDFVACNDGQWTQGLQYWNDLNARKTKEEPFAASLGSFVAPPACAFWRSPNTNPTVNAATFPKVIVLQDELDGATAYEAGSVTGTRLPGARFIATDNESSHGAFPYSTECVDRPIIDYFLTGKGPSKKVTICSAKPLPKETETFEMWGTLGPNGRERPAVLQPSAAARAATEATSDLLALGGFEHDFAPFLRQYYGSAGVDLGRKAVAEH